MKEEENLPGVKGPVRPPAGQVQRPCGGEGAKPPLSHEKLLIYGTKEASPDTKNDNNPVKLTFILSRWKLALVTIFTKSMLFCKYRYYQ